jgi:hypothetical protein
LDFKFRALLAVRFYATALAFYAHAVRAREGRAGLVRIGAFTDLATLKDVRRRRRGELEVVVGFESQHANRALGAVQKHCHFVDTNFA